MAVEPSDIRLIIIRGLPGSGKSTMALILESLGFTRVEADDFVYDANGVKFRPPRNADEMVFRKVEESLLKGERVVVAGVYPSYKFILRFKSLAAKLNVKCNVLVAEGDHGDIHNCPENRKAVLRRTFEYKF